MQRHGRLLLCVLTCMGGALLTSCQAQTSHTAGTPTRVVPGAQVPLVRSLPMVAMAAPMVIEFDLQRPSENATATLFLGLRVAGEDGLKSLEAAQAVRRSGLDAELVLKRLEPQGNINVPLVRVDSQAGVPARIVAVSTDGLIHGMWLDDVDKRSLQSAGLDSARRHYTQLAFAWAQDVQPGKYQLSIRLPNPPTQLASTESELLVAYRHKSK